MFEPWTELGWDPPKTVIGKILSAAQNKILASKMHETAEIAISWKSVRFLKPTYRGRQKTRHLIGQ